MSMTIVVFEYAEGMRSKFFELSNSGAKVLRGGSGLRVALLDLEVVLSRKSFPRSVRGMKVNKIQFADFEPSQDELELAASRRPVEIETPTGGMRL